MLLLAFTEVGQDVVQRSDQKHRCGDTNVQLCCCRVIDRVATETYFSSFISLKFTGSVVVVVFFLQIIIRDRKSQETTSNS